MNVNTAGNVPRLDRVSVHGAIKTVDVLAMGISAHHHDVRKKSASSDCLPQNSRPADFMAPIVRICIAGISFSLVWCTSG